MDGLEQIPYGQNGKIYQMKSSFRNYEQSKILGHEANYPIDDGRSLKA
jgi:hypothetical protein